MVLYKRKAIILPDPKPLPFDLNVDVWHIDETGEWYVTYEEYLERLDFYARHHFTCEITGTSCLTFFQALDSEETQFKYVEERFPLKLREPVARFLHFNGIKRLDALVEKVYARFKNDFFPGETVYLRKSSKEHSAPSSTQATPQPDDALFRNSQSEESTQPQYQKPYIIKEKAQFNATKDPETGSVIMPEYSKYMLIEGNHGSKSLIADQSQLYRDRSTFTKHLIKCFCKITLKRASTKMGAPWAVKEEYLPMYGLTMEWPADMVKFKEDDNPLSESARNKRSRPTDDAEDGLQDNEENIEDLQDLNREDEDDNIKKRKTEDIKENPNMHENSTAPIITSIIDDLALPFQGPSNIFENMFQYNKQLENVSMEDCSLSEPFRKIERLLQVFQFLNTFGPKIFLSYFNLDQFVTSIKCTDPQELKGEMVIVNFAGDRSSSKSESPSGWRRNPYFRHLIESKNSKDVSYKIVKAEPASEDIIDNINHNGANLLIESFVSLLRLFIDEEGDWQVLIPEQWLTEAGEDQEKCDDEVDKPAMKANASEEEKEEFETALNNCLNFRNVNWAERLTKRQFNGGYWLMILLGILETCKHIPTYAETIINFERKTVPQNVSTSYIPKQLWRNFCNLHFEEKLDILWILVDAVSHFSPEIKSAVESSMDLCNQIRSERFRVAKDLKSETSTLNVLQLSLQNLEQAANKDDSTYQEVMKKLETQKEKVENLQSDKDYLGRKLTEHDLQRLKPLGTDRYGNKYYWLDFSGVPVHNRPAIDEKDIGEHSTYHSGRVWIQGPSEAAAKFFLNISSEDVAAWTHMAHEKGSSSATKEAFHIYRANDGSYRHFDEAGETVLVNPEKVSNNLIELSPIQRKVIDESPEHLLLSEDQWYSIERKEDLRRLLDWLDNWGRREHDLLRQFKLLESDLECSYVNREKRLKLFELDQFEEKLLKELKENELTEEELALDVSSFKDDTNEGSVSASENDIADDHERELESIAEEIMKLDDCSKTRKILNRIQELENRRDGMLRAKQLVEDSGRPGARVQARAEKKRIRNRRANKLERQSEILTELLNHRHFQAMTDVIEWKNELAIRIWGSSLRKNGSGNKKVHINETVGEKMEEIMAVTSKMTAATHAN